MHATSVWDWLITALLAGLLLWAAASDMRERRISNGVVLAVLALFIPWTVAGHVTELGWSLLCGAGALVVTYLLFANKIVGAGDAKLFSAVALFVGPSYFGLYGLATVLSGGVVAVILLSWRAARTLAPAQLGKWPAIEGGVPYGVAIACGGLLVQIGRLTGSLTPSGLA